ncbi:MAG: acyl-CoA dehydrogenase family protein [SAR324 cluster bacterium]|nr:acyl-CoA dehydrogenase family protein [SAR324 cluster bacterium]
MSFVHLVESVGEKELFNPTPEHQALREMVREFSTKELEPQAKACDETETFNQELFQQLGKELTLFGVTVPEKDGGLGMDPVASTIIIEEMSAVDPGFALSYLAHEVLFVNNFYISSNLEQRKKYLAPTINGSWIAGMAMTEPGVGTDVLGMATTAEDCGDHFLLNGVKQFITNATLGSIFLVYAKLNKESRAVSSFVVTSDLPGFSVGKKEEKMGMRSSPTAQLMFEGVQLPKENLLGQLNEGMMHMMRNLEIERVTLAAQSLGIARSCLEVAANYAIRERSQFGKPLSSFGQIQRMVAEGFAEYQAARTLVYTVARQISPLIRKSLGAASAKLVATRMAEKVGREMIQVLGGYGYTRDYPIERLYRDAILLSIGGGTNEAMQKNIIKDISMGL